MLQSTFIIHFKNRSVPDVSWALMGGYLATRSTNMFEQANGS